MNRRLAVASLLALAVALPSACADTREPPPPPPGGSIRDGAPVTYEVLYEAGTYSEPGFGVVDRPWIPLDLSVSHEGELWVVQRMARAGGFDDETECTSRSQTGEANDCAGLQGSTVAITDPALPEAATAANGRAELVVDANSWHFMRRPSSIAFGAPLLEVDMTNEGARDPVTNQPLGAGTLSYTNTFATCHEHWTGNFTDQGPFIGPTVWTSDPTIYNGVNGTFEWSNGAHLDMVHATRYCMGIAYERDNVYWTFNGEEGTLDRYDFGAPHVPGHGYHGDGIVTRFDVGAMPLLRLPDVPSNLEVRGTLLYVADTGNGRVMRFDMAQPTTVFGTFLTDDSFDAEMMDGGTLAPIADRATLEAAWGARVEPSGLAFLGDDLLIGNHGSGHISLVGPDGVIVRTLDTGLGAGLGGITVLDGVVYFAHLTTRRVYRIAVQEPVEG